ncbi:MAG: SoxR reducing system RseC family protein [Rheinheimera sp.]|nr:SoxR reducing system RseC family protein [Rheinheimera sp.]
MVEEIATVVACDDNGLWLTTTPVASCNRCQASADCGTGIVAKTLTPRTLHFFVPSTLKLLPGEQVKIGLAEPALINAALMVYLLPLCLMLLLALLGAGAGANEGIQMLLALLGAVAGFMLARRYGKRQEQHNHIQILTVLPTLTVHQHS